MKIQDVMVRAVHCCSPDDSLNRAAQLMWEHVCGSVPVVDAERRVVGMVTDRDVCMAAYTKGLPLVEIRVADVMSREVRTCCPEDTILDAEDAMRACHARRVPVVDAEAKLVGILSLDDLAGLAASNRSFAKDGLDLADVARTLASINLPWRTPLAGNGAADARRAEAKLALGAEEC
jgi:CBS domain-containing protein